MWYDLIPGSQAFLAIEKLQNHNENLEGIQRFKRHPEQLLDLQPE